MVTLSRYSTDDQKAGKISKRITYLYERAYTKDSLLDEDMYEDSSEATSFYQAASRQGSEMKTNIGRSLTAAERSSS